VGTQPTKSHMTRITIVVCLVVFGFDTYSSWYLREYESAQPHDKAVLEYRGHTLYVECDGTHYSSSGDVPTCGWLQQHVGQHLREGEKFKQITRLGPRVCYHDGAGGIECYVVVRETAAGKD